MPHILIVDSNPAANNDKLRAAGAPSAGEGYAQALGACRNDLTIAIVAPYDEDAMPAMDDFDGLVFTGSSVDWSTDDPRAEPLARVMRAGFAAGLPVLGSCNGMLLAASVLGGSTQASPNGREDGLARDVRLTEAGRRHPLLSGRRDGYAVPCVHRDEVVRLPEGAILLAGNAHSPVQAFACERGGVRFWGMQYHPEYPADFIGGYMASSGRMPPDAADALRVADSDPDAAARLGIRAGELAPEVRLTEVRNWLALV